MICVKYANGFFDFSGLKLLDVSYTVLNTVTDHVLFEHVV